MTLSRFFIFLVLDNMLVIDNSLLTASREVWNVFTCTIPTNMHPVQLDISQHWKKSTSWKRKYSTRSTMQLLTGRFAWTRTWLVSLLGLQSGYAKHPCFLCLWNSQAKHEHWVRKDWPPCQQMAVSESNAFYKTLLPRTKIILPLIYMKLGLMKKFVKALDKEGNCFEYICKAIF